MKLTSQSELAKEVTATGFAFLPSHLPSQSSHEAILQLGLVEKLDGLSEIQELTPKEAAESPPNIYSGNFGYGEFPYHTDLAHWFTPPRLLVLRCVEGARDVKTRLIDSTFVIQSFGEDELRRTIVLPRRPIDRSRLLLRILERCSTGESRFRWDSLFIVPATDLSSRTYQAIQSSLSIVKPAEFVLEKPGDTLVVDNWRILHARSAVPKAQRCRKIHRAYLSTLL
jgi:alpha-ketoglutarate-dependent taurine dioxygenase